MTATNGPTADDVVAGLDLSDRTVLVTGATSGIGRETARALASAGARVLLAGRGADRLAAARAGLLDAAPAADLSTLELDLASLAGVRAAAERVMDEVARLDALVNNAGVMFTPFGRTPDGFETQIGVNHLGHFLLTRLLDPLLGEGSRVVTVSSAGHKLADVDLADLSWRHRRYDKFAAYGASKTANILFTVALEAGLRERGAHAFAVHPGTVATDLARHMDRADFAELGRLAAAAS